MRRQTQIVSRISVWSVLARKLIRCVLLGCSWVGTSFGQTDAREFYRSHAVIKFTTYWFPLGGGRGFGAGVGIWRDAYVGANGNEWARVQPGMNLSINVSMDSRNLGNRNRFNTRTQVSTVLSPLVTLGSSSRGFSEELHPFYFGNTKCSICQLQILRDSRYKLCGEPPGIRKECLYFSQ